MLISTVILSYNSEATIQKCLQHVVDAVTPFGEPWEVFVVDNGSTDASRTAIDRFAAHQPTAIHPIYFDRNTGTTFSRNTALRQSRGRYILVLDSDAYVDHVALKALIERLHQHPRTGIAAPRLLYATGGFQLSCDVFPTIGRKALRFFFLKELERVDKKLSEAESPVPVDYAISACWALRRDVLDKVGYLDEKIFYSPEDADYCLRVWENGLEVTYVPQVSVVHDAQELSRGFQLSRFHFSHLRGLFYLQWKHRYFLGRSLLYRRLKRTTR